MPGAADRAHPQRGGSSSILGENGVTGQASRLTLRYMSSDRPLHASGPQFPRPHHGRPCRGSWTRTRHTSRSMGCPGVEGCRGRGPLFRVWEAACSPLQLCSEPGGRRDTATLADCGTGGGVQGRARALQCPPKEASAQVWSPAPGVSHPSTHLISTAALGVGTGAQMTVSAWTHRARKAPRVSS